MPKQKISFKDRQTEALRAMLAATRRQGQALPTDPHWIVVNMSPHKTLHPKWPTFPFRHPSVEAATAEAERLANLPKARGSRFAVFAFTGITRKVEPVPMQEAAD